MRLTDAEEYPDHGQETPNTGALGSWKEWRAREIAIELPPEAPNEYWKCGTPVVWRVIDPVPPNGSARYCVCIHQIQAD